MNTSLPLLIVLLCSLTLVIESRESICRDEVMSGKYDFTPFLAPYPSLHPNITKGVFFSQASRDILTALENHTFRQRVPNYLVYSTDVYFTCLLFFLIWSVSNAFVSSLFHSNRRFGSVVLKSFFLVTTAHMKSINTRSPNKLLQLSLLISVTVGISVNNARFSNENIRIHSPKVYTSYKSLFEDPPDAIFARKHELDSIDQLKFQSSSPEMYLKKLRPKMIDMSEFFKRPRGKGVKIVVLSSTSNVDVKFLRWEIIQRGIKKISVIRKRDPNAEKTFWHAAISASIFDRPGSKKILWTFKVVQEGDLIHGIIRRGKSLILHSKNLSGPSFRKVLFDRHKPPNFEVNRVKDVSIDSFKAILPFFSWLYLSACLTIVVEIALLTQILVPVYRKNRVQSLGRPLAQRIIQKQLSSQSTNE